MKVKELIKSLEKLDQEKEVLLASDGEGNNYRKMGEIWDSAFCIFRRYEIDIYSKEDKPDEALPCVVLYP